MTTIEFQAMRGGVASTGFCTFELMPDGSWRVQLDIGETSSTGTADDAFDALRTARRELEPSGWRLGLAGARVDVWPSGMARAAGGTRAYVLDESRIAVRATLDIVDVFAPIDPRLAGTESEQLSLAERVLGVTMYSRPERAPGE